MRAYEYMWVDFSKLEFEEMKLLLADYASAGWEVVADAPVHTVLGTPEELALMLARPLPPAPGLKRAA